VLSAFFSGALIVLILIWFHTKISEYGTDVSDTIRSLSVLQAIALLVAALVIMWLNGMAMKTPLNGITNTQAFIAQQSSSAISNVIPGPSGTAARFAILYSWKVSVEDFTRGTVAVSIWNNVIMISMPGIAFVVLAISGDSEASGQTLVVAAVIAVLVSITAIGVVIGGLRSERFARWLGRVTQRLINPPRKLFRRKPIEDLDEACAELRRRTVDVLSERKGRLTAITLSAYWLNGLLLVACMWLSGVPHAELGLLVGLALYSIGRLSTLVQITPGGVGVVEVAYSAVYLAVVPDQYNAEVVTGVLLYRLLTYVLPILVGGVTYLAWRIMRSREKKAEAATAQAAPESAVETAT